MNSVAAEEQASIQLDDVMLAMDVVDTLRHQQSLVDHALDADERDEALTARIKKIYLDQGIEVSDAVVADGVRALREERFSYKPPPGGIKTWFARAYVRRKQAYKPFAAALAILAILWGGHYAMVSLPQQRENLAAMNAYNEKVIESQNRIVAIDGNIERAQAALANAGPAPADMRETESVIRLDTEKAIAAARHLSTAAANIKTTMVTEVDDYIDDKTPLNAQLSERQALLKQLNTQSDSIADGADLLALIATLPREVSEIEATVRGAAKEDKANQLAANHAENAIAALKRRDLSAARGALDSLKQLASAVQSEYQILVISRPGEKSGVWRYPNDNRDAKNYYLIVEAVTGKGTKLPQLITSEEDGATRTVSTWGMRVDQGTYNRIAADKRDDGIIQNKLVGSKGRGYVTPEFVLNTSGGAITSW